MKFKINSNYLIFGFINLLAHLLIRHKKDIRDNELNLIQRIKFALLCFLMWSKYLICYGKLLESVITKSNARFYFEIKIFWNCCYFHFQFEIGHSRFYTVCFIVTHLNSINILDSLFETVAQLINYKFCHSHICISEHLWNRVFFINVCVQKQDVSRTWIPRLCPCQLDA